MVANAEEELIFQFYVLADLNGHRWPGAPTSDAAAVQLSSWPARRDREQLPRGARR